MIIWGRKKVTKVLGRVVDFCPICRKVSAFTLIRVGMAGHIYYISLSEGSLIGNEIQCEVCGCRIVADATNYKFISTNKMSELNQLIYETNPEIEKKYATRLLAEEKLKMGTIGQEDRTSLIREALILGSSVSVPGPETNTNPGVIIGFSIFIISILSVLILPAVLSHIPVVTTVLACIGVAFVGFLLAAFSAKRMAGGNKSKRLITALKALNPSFSELDDSIKFLRSAGYNSVQRLDAGKVLTSLESIDFLTKETADVPK